MGDDGRYVLGVDLGGTKIAFGLVDTAGRVIHQLVVPTRPEDGTSTVIGRIVGGIDEVAGLAGGRGVIRGIGIAAPGVLDVQAGRVIFAPNLHWRDVPVCETLRRELKLPLFLENDANAAALGEKYFGAGQGIDDLLYITISTGIGGGLILGGQVYRGCHGNAGEIGHMVLEPEGPVCGCGNRGCWEAVASGRAIASRAAERIAAGQPSALGEVLRRGRELTAVDVAAAAQAGDGLAREILRTTVRYVGLGVASLVTVFDPEMVILGGGVSRIGDSLLCTVTEVVRQRTLPTAGGDVRIVLSALQDAAGVVGAAAVAFSRLGILE